MYTPFWGFREKPFRQVPNPEFLFLSQTHEEALAHLNYALVEGEGFVMMTGEVGTGKSTLCRTFFKKLDADTFCAYIFNSKLDPLQLLKSINVEFGIAADADTVCELVDALNSFLIEKRAAGQKAIIVIDEAQNLPVESLEQVRLLSNLETTREKLLHLVLVGQPELADLIASYPLRQLGQRIQLACHLNPLTYQETIQYIHHRINLVSDKPQMPFDKGALRAIYAFSQGVPRLINTACDRMLLAAFLKNRNRIKSGMASRVIIELRHRGRPSKITMSWDRVAIAVGVVIVASAAVGLFIIDRQVPYLSAKVSKQAPAVHDHPVQMPVTDNRYEIGVKIKSEEGKFEPKDDSKSLLQKQDRTRQEVIPLAEWLRLIENRETRRPALEAVLRQWRLAPEGDRLLSEADSTTFFETAAKRHGLSLLTIEDEIDTLVQLNLPAIVTLTGPEADRTLYAGLVGIQPDGLFKLMIYGEDITTLTDAMTLMRYWGRKAFIPWKNYMGYEGIVPGGAPRSAVVPLKQLLWEIGNTGLIIDDRYDEMTRQAVMKIQRKHGLKVDGLVGNMTKIVLFNEKQSLPIPHLGQVIDIETD